MIFKKQVKLMCFWGLILSILSSFQLTEQQFNLRPDAKYNLKFSALATTWDEAMPLGNSMLGALIWKKADKLRMSLDRADLWDLRRFMYINRIIIAQIDNFPYFCVELNYKKVDKSLIDST